MRRIRSQEWLDDDLGSPREIQKSFDDLWRINRWLGGVSGTLHLLERFFARRGSRHVRILDVGSGDSRMAVYLQEELARRNHSAQVVALDRRISHLRNGNHSSGSLLQVVGDVADLPFPRDSFDLVMSNLFLHHFSESEAVELFRRLAEVASEAVLINDLERNPLPYVFIQAAWPFARSHITRHDGAASVRQAYTKKELEDLAGRAGFGNFHVERLPFFRLGLTLWKS